MAKCKMQTVAGQQHAAAGQQRAVACQQHNTGYVHTYSHVHMVTNRIIEKRWQTLSNRQYVHRYIHICSTFPSTCCTYVNMLFY